MLTCGAMRPKGAAPPSEPHIARNLERSAKQNLERRKATLFSCRWARRGPTQVHVRVSSSFEFQPDGMGTRCRDRKGY